LEKPKYFANIEPDMLGRTSWIIPVILIITTLIPSSAAQSQAMPESYDSQAVVPRGDENATEVKEAVPVEVTEEREAIPEEAMPESYDRQPVVGPSKLPGFHASQLIIVISMLYIFDRKFIKVK
jgi:hypothetical protein